ncbi:PAS/PAC sensor signal transduction histidine kinase [Spirochaeta thermophila DSM 6578]|uniref:histidine kinase n=1 Tax=Winmispira thermophila (strain ATCC 700085 / DSM 6578 / Z-1203) TaxID=869211 RepID=G0GA23_WINT7|nr:ATP-binding protein [Spirochaeta thermophila]AEJ61711.1 PAS/PAC sensor signal transduction histidine kinase [Spirochaeta thermophila DSM 6578]
MKLRTKLILVFSSLLVLHTALNTAFVLLFYSERLRRTEEEILTGTWETVKGSLEALKRDMLNALALLNSHLETPSPTLPRLASLICATTPADRVVLLDQGGRILVDHYSYRIREPFALPSLSLSSFRFPRALYLLAPVHGRPSLLLVAGSPYHTPAGSGHALLFTLVDEDRLLAWNPSRDTRVALSTPDHILASQTPRFTPPLDAAFREIRIGNHPFLAYTRLLSGEVPEGLYLITLRSALPGKIDLRTIGLTILALFLLTLLISAALAAGSTTHFLSPLQRLLAWLPHAQEHPLPPLSSRDEIGLIAHQASHIVKTLLEEERIIREQYREIARLTSYNRQIVSSLRAGIVVARPDGTIEFCNTYFADMLGTSPPHILGRLATPLISASFHLPTPVEDLDLSRPTTLERVRLASSERVFTLKIQPFESADRKGGEPKALLVFEEVTELEALWKTLLISERISALGALSAGLAHEINNPLGAISSHLAYLLSVEDDPERRESLLWIEKEITRIGNLVKTILSHARGRTEGPCDVDRTLRDTIGLLSPQARQKRIALSYTSTGPLPSALISEAELKQVALNILKNAMESIGEGGSIQVEARSVDDGLVIAFHDTGPGFPEPSEAHLFDPLFTTKAEGTGLGMTITHHIIQRAGGRIAVRNRTPSGATVEVRLRAAGSTHR